MTQVTRSWTKTLSNPFVLEGTGRLSILSLILLGVVAGILHVHLKYPLDIPGHHGLEWMALVLFGRCLSNNRYAASILAGSAAASYLSQSAFLPLAHDVKPALIFLLTGACADIIFRFSRDRLPMLVNAGLIGGLAFVSKPLIMYCLFLGGMKVGTFIKNPDYLPFLSHLLFGMVGGVGGAILARGAMIINKKDQAT